jgi:hypothetical protein
MYRWLPPSGHLALAAYALQGKADPTGPPLSAPASEVGGGNTTSTPVFPLDMEKTFRTSRVTIRLTSDEFSKLGDLHKRSLDPYLASYIRKVILQKPVLIRTRDVSTDALLEEMILLKREVNAIGVNLNQAVKKLHTADRYPEIQKWLTQQEPFVQTTCTLIEQIATKMNDIYQHLHHGSHR